MASEAFDNSLFQYDAGYYQYMPGRWLPGKLVPGIGDYTFSRRAVDAAVALEMHDSDVLVDSFMKTGQNWTLKMINMMIDADKIQRGSPDDVTKEHFYQFVFLEMEQADGPLCNDVIKEHPVYMRTHLPLSLLTPQLEKHPNIKIIQTLRNPKDTLVSLYHHLSSDNNLGGFKGTWDQFFEQIFLKGRLPWGNLFENTADWYKFNKDRKNSLTLKYEDTRKHHKRQVVKIAQFLGFDLPEETTDDIVQQSSLEPMQKEFGAMINQRKSWKKGSNLVRKGQIGDWTNYFSQEQSEYVDAQCKEYFEPLGLTFEYSI